jgi:LPXTG-motif cell wall-anchored protein
MISQMSAYHGYGLGGAAEQMAAKVALAKLLRAREAAAAAEGTAQQEAAAAALEQAKLRQIETTTAAYEAIAARAGAQPEPEQPAGNNTLLYVGIGAAALLGVGLFLLMRRKHGATPNPRRRRYRANRLATAYGKSGRRLCSAWKGKVPTCRCTAPKKYRRLGATARSDYAFPECYMYPIRFRAGRKVKARLTAKHVRNAATRFGRFHKRYPKPVARRIAARIRKAATKYGIGFSTRVRG